ncbi:MAG: FecR family protein [Cyclobacteriaceae bacterium]
MNNNNYTLEELIADESFVLWAYGEGGTQWDEWVNANPGNGELADKAQEMIASMKFKGYALTDDKVEQIKQRIEVNIESEGGKVIPIQSRWKKWTKVAAVVAVLLASAVVLYTKRESESTTVLSPIAIKYLDKTTPKGARVTFKLSDGSTVNLNANSKLIYPESFDEDNREVYLEGEAFFDVAENVEKPFIVTTGDIQTKVLGTTFNIKALTSSENIEVALVTGSISLSNLKSSESLLLKPDEMGTYNGSSQPIIKSLYDRERVLGWKEQLLTFSNTDFSEVIESLENWYGVSFVIKSKKKFTKGFTGKYKNKSLETVMKGLSFSYEFNFRISDKVIIIE